MATSVRSPRNWRTSLSMPSSKSVSSPRSCTSSRMTALTVSSPGSASRRFNRMPGVTNSMIVPGPVWRSPRTVYPTRSPSPLPSNAARRRAAERAATRRGWVTMMRGRFSRPGPRPAPKARLASNGGTRVVLPVPGGACTTAVAAGTLACSTSASSPRARPNARPAPITPRSKGTGAGGGGEVTLPLCLQSRGAGFRPELAGGLGSLQHRIGGLTSGTFDSCRWRTRGPTLCHDRRRDARSGAKVRRRRGRRVAGSGVVAGGGPGGGTRGRIA